MSKSTSSRSVKSVVDSESTRNLRKCIKWDKDKIQELLSHELKSRRVSEGKTFKEWSDRSGKRNPRLGATLRSGLYSIPLLKDLLQNGMPAQSVAKAMKYGLVSLNPAELSYLKDLGAEPHVLQDQALWYRRMDIRLIENLCQVGLKENECWNIIVNGLTQLRPGTLSHLVLGGIDVPGILNWQDSSNRVSSSVLEFLHRTGFDEEIIQLIEQYGVNDVCLGLLNDLVESETCKEYSDSEEIVCTCSSKLGGESVESSGSSSTLHSLQYFLNKFICTCPSESSVDLIAEASNYLRRNVMIALTWAMARTLHYRPTDPQYYLAYQLLRWSHGAVSQAEKKEAYEFVTSASKRIDFKLAMRKLHEEDEARAKEAREKIPCEKCLDRPEVIRKKGCPGCTKGPREPEACALPELCSGCKLPAEKASVKEVCNFPEFCSFCRLSEHRGLSGTEVDEFPEACKLDVEEAEAESCALPELCSRCRL